MASVHFTSWLRELVPDAPLLAAGGTVGEALAAALIERPQVRAYLIDEQGRLRRHVCVFADGQRLGHQPRLRTARRRYRKSMSCRLCREDEDEDQALVAHARAS